MRSGSGTGLAIRRLENSVNTAVNGYLRIRQQKERDGFRLSPYSGPLALTARTAIRLWETFIFFKYVVGFLHCHAFAAKY